MQKISHISEAKALMLSQFDNSPDLQALVESLILPIEGIEQDIFDFLDSNTVTTAIGEILDIIGSWVGVERGFKGDEEYRQAILGKALTEASDGSTSQLYSGVRTICQTDEVTFYESTLHPIIYVHVGDGWTNSTFDQISNIKMAGVSHYLLVDKHLQSLKLGELRGDGSSNLVDHIDRNYVVDVEGVEHNLLVSKSNSSSAISSRGTLGEYGSKESGTPLVDLVVGSSSQITGYITDNEGKTLISDDSLKINYRDLI